MSPGSIQRAGARQLAELGKLERDGTLEVRMRDDGFLLRREERSAQAGVADVAARDLVLPRQRREIERALGRQLARQVDAPQLLAGVLVGERERQLERDAALERRIDRAAEVRGEHRDALERVEAL